MSFLFGTDAKLYRGPAGSQASTEVTNVTDLTLNDSCSEVDVTTRASGGIKEYAQGLRELSLDWDQVYDPDDAGFVAVRTAYLAKTPIALMALTKEGGEGPDADFAIMKFERQEPLDGVIKVSVTAKPTRSTRAPGWQE